MNNLTEKGMFQESLTKRPLTPKELLEMFVFAVEDSRGSCPSYILTLLKGLGAASEKLPLLGIFVGAEGEMHLSRELKSAFEDRSLEGYGDEEWRKIHIANSAKTEIAIRTVLTPEGQIAFKEAAEAANEVWLKQAS